MKPTNNAIVKGAVGGLPNRAPADLLGLGPLTNHCLAQ
jgi:hypothetical protein